MSYVPPSRRGGDGGGGRQQRQQSGASSGGGGGWRERMAAKQAGGGSLNTQRGEVLRISSSGFGFVGDGPTARKRLHFNFQDVLDGRHAELKTGTLVEYCVRTDDATMEQEAYDIRIVESARGAGGCRASGSTSSSASRGSRVGGSGGGGGGGWRDRAGGGGQSQGLKAWAARGGGTTAQQTSAPKDHTGKRRDEGGGGGADKGNLIGIIGLGTEDGVEWAIAKSFDDYDHNPTRGNGFDRAYQISRGVKPAEVNETSDQVNADDSLHLFTKAKQEAGADLSTRTDRMSVSKQSASADTPKWQPRRGNGRGRSLAELAGDSGGSALQSNSRATKARW